MVDEDTARSGKSTDGRDGFQRLVAEVGLGRVGIVLGIEVSRLARRNADWYGLLDLCALTDTLIADSDGIYHPALHNDRLRARAEGHDERGGAARAARPAARRQPAQGGQGRAAAAAARRLGVRRDRAGQDHPGRGGRGRDQDGVLVLRSAAERQAGDAAAAGGGPPAAAQVQPADRQVRWATPSYKAIHDILTNPVFAGAYAYGRKQTERRVHRRRGPRAPAPHAARGVARVHRGPPPRLHHLRALPRQPAAAARELAPAARGGRRRRARGPGAVAGADPLRALRPADAGRLQRQDARAQLQLRARQPAIRHRALPVGRRAADRAGRARRRLPGVGTGRDRGDAPRDRARQR